LKKPKEVGDYKALLGNDKTVSMLEETMAQFQRVFHEGILSRVEFSATLEVRGDKGSLSYLEVRDRIVRRPIRNKTDSANND